WNVARFSRSAPIESSAVASVVSHSRLNSLVRIEPKRFQSASVGRVSAQPMAYSRTTSRPTYFWDLQLAIDGLQKRKAARRAAIKIARRRSKKDFDVQRVPAPVLGRCARPGGLGYPDVRSPARRRGSQRGSRQRIGGVLRRIHWPLDGPQQNHTEPRAAVVHVRLRAAVALDRADRAFGDVLTVRPHTRAVGPRRPQDRLDPVFQFIQHGSRPSESSEYRL